MLKANHPNQRFALENLVLRKYPADVAKLTESIACYKKDETTAQAHPKPTAEFVGMEIMGTHYPQKGRLARPLFVPVRKCKSQVSFRWGGIEVSP